jgi:type IV secretory pathway VirJ component
MALLLATLHLPLVEKPVAGGQPYFALLLTGDGGWRAIDAGLTEELNRHGIPVAGLLSDQYFSVPRMPEEVARDVERTIEHYAELWGKPRVILVGFSRGADALPIVLTHMPEESRRRVAVAAMLGASRSAELHVVPFWKDAKVPSITLAPLVNSIRDVRMVCVHGEDEDESLCDVLRSGAAVDVKTPGGHHFAGRYAEIARTILRALP